MGRFDPDGPLMRLYSRPKSRSRPEDAPPPPRVEDPAQVGRSTAGPPAYDPRQGALKLLASRAAAPAATPYAPKAAGGGTPPPPKQPQAMPWNPLPATPPAGGAGPPPGPPGYVAADDAMIDPDEAGDEATGRAIARARAGGGQEGGARLPPSPPAAPSATRVPPSQGPVGLDESEQALLPIPDATIAPIGFDPFDAQATPPPGWTWIDDPNQPEGGFWFNLDKAGGLVSTGDIDPGIVEAPYRPVDTSEMFGTNDQGESFNLYDRQADAPEGWIWVTDRRAPEGGKWVDPQSMTEAELRTIATKSALADEPGTEDEVDAAVAALWTDAKKQNMAAADQMAIAGIGGTGAYGLNIGNIYSATAKQAAEMRLGSALAADTETTKRLGIFLSADLEKMSLEQSAEQFAKTFGLDEKKLAALLADDSEADAWQAALNIFAAAQQKQVDPNTMAAFVDALKAAMIANTPIQAVTDRMQLVNGVWVFGGAEGGEGGEDWGSSLPPPPGSDYSPQDWEKMTAKEKQDAYYVGIANAHLWPAPPSVSSGSYAALDSEQKFQAWVEYLAMGNA